MSISFPDPPDYINRRKTQTGYFPKGRSNTDAMGCQKAIARDIPVRGADDILGLEGNQSKLQDEVESFFFVVVVFGALMRSP